MRFSAPAAAGGTAFHQIDKPGTANDLTLVHFTFTVDTTPFAIA